MRLLPTLLALCLIATAQARNTTVAIVQAPAAAGATYLVSDNYEETDSAGALGSSTDGYDAANISAETISGDGTITPDGTTATVFQGSQQLEAAGALGYVEYDLGANYSNVWVFFKTGNWSGNNRAIAYGLNASRTQVFALDVDGSWQWGIDVATGTDARISSATSGWDLGVWAHWQAGTTCTIHLSTGTDEIRADAGANFDDGSDGSSETIRYIRFGNVEGGVSIRADKLRVDDAEIGNSPL